MKKNDVFISKVENLGFNGEGILHFEGATVFVPFALPDEEIEFKILKVKKNIAFAKLLRVITPAYCRVESSCPAYKKCGGCQLLHINYQAQLKLKQEVVRDCFKKIAGLNLNVDSVVPSTDVFRYRNKLQLPIRNENGEIKIGFFREGSHSVIDIDDCLLQPSWAIEIIKIIRNYIKQNNVSCFDDKTSKGLLKHLVVREVNGHFLICIVATNRKISAINRLIDLLLVKFSNFSLILNVNELNNNVVLGGDFYTLYGNGKISVEEFGICFDLGIQSFFQVNSAVKEKLYKKAFELAEIDDKTVVIDGYSGAGVLTATFAKIAKKAIGVEIIKEAVDSANELARTNNLSEKMFSYCGDCADVLPKLIKQAKIEGSKTVVVLDPPRKGVDYKVLEQILESLPDKVIYISCSPQTLARDIGILLGALKYENNAIINTYSDLSNYICTKVIPFDMFPQTRHVESVVCLKRRLDNELPMA